MPRCLLRIATAALAFALGIGGTLLWVTLRAPGVNDLKVSEQAEPGATNQSARAPQSNKPPRTVLGGVMQSKSISRPKPPYPPEAKAAGVSGTVVVEIISDETGQVVSAHAVSGPEMLRAAAEQAAMRARFSPTLLSGQPVRVAGTLVYNFVLD